MDELLENKYISSFSWWDGNIIIHFKEWYESDPQCRFIANSKKYNWRNVIIWVKH